MNLSNLGWLISW